MLLHDLLGDVDVLELRGSSQVEVSAIAHDSRRTGPGALFACIPGREADGHDHAAAAVGRGAGALLVERLLPLDVPQVRVPEVRAALGPVAAHFHGRPSRSMTVLGVTGTNGKTTVTYLLDAIATAAGRRSAVMGTTGARIGEEALPLEFTTPEAPDLQALLARMRDARVDVVAMEVSSHALEMRRVDGTHFGAVGFTNLSQDHLDLHHTLEAYYAAKARLFGPEFSTVGVVNVDDPWGARLAREAAIEVWRCGTSGDVEVCARDLEPVPNGTSFRLAGTRVDGELPVRLHLLGRFNVENAVVAAGMALAAGLPRDAVVSGLSSPVVVPGRMEPVDAGQPFTVLVDYAHTPEALGAVLREARLLTSLGGRVHVVFGCGGNRDPDKREPMGRAATAADDIVVTSDNPRSEDPAVIAAAVVHGVHARGRECTLDLDRRAAIRHALAATEPGDVVVVAGKGHEAEQRAGTSVTSFDDRVVVREELESLGWR